MRTRSWNALVALLSSGCATTQVKREAITHPGQALFNGYANPRVECHKCHKGDATGTWAGPSLDVVSDYPDAQILEVLDEGPGIMPSYKGVLSEDERRQLIEWLRSRFPR